MPRKILLRSAIFPYHVFNKTIDGTFYPSLQMAEIWSFACDTLKVCTWAFGARIHAFILMSNHYHLLVTTPDENLDKIIQYFQSELSLKLSQLNQLQKYSFGQRYKWNLISNPRYFMTAYRYVYQNAFRSQLVEIPENYPWSTLHGKVGNSRLEVPLFHSQVFRDFVPVEIEEERAWVNEAIETAELTDLQIALQHSQLKIGKRLNKVRKGSKKVQEGLLKVQEVTKRCSDA